MKIAKNAATEMPPATASVVANLWHEWGDAAWMASRERRNRLDVPVSIYELHLGSFLTMDEMLAAIDAVRFEEVQALVTELLDEDRLALTTLGPLDRRHLPRDLLRH